MRLYHFHICADRDNGAEFCFKRGYCECRCGARMNAKMDTADWMIWRAPEILAVKNEDGAGVSE